MKDRRGRSKGETPFQRRDVDVSMNPSKRCLIGRLMGVEWCAHESCWLWNPNKRCALSALVVKAIIYLNSRIQDAENRRREMDEELGRRESDNR